MKTYPPEVEELLYRVYVARSKAKQMGTHLDPELRLFLIGSTEELIAGLLARLVQHGLQGDELEKAIEDRWLDFEANEMRFSRADKCLTHLAIIQAKLKTSVDVYHPSLFTCDLHEDCLECDSFNEATEEQLVRFLHSQDLFTEEDIPLKGVDLDFDK